MRHVIWTAISHGHIKERITTVASHGCMMKHIKSLPDNIMTFNLLNEIKISICNLKSTSNTGSVKPYL